MRLIACVATALVLLLVAPASAQEWDEHVFIEDGFKVNFPGKPVVANFTWTSQNGYPLPARTYKASRGPARYSVTVVDYRPLEALGIERAKTCAPGAETCEGTNDGRQGAITGPGYWKMDSRGAMTYAVFKLVSQPGVTISDMSLQFVAVVSSYSLHLVNPDKSRTFATVTMHENRLYIFEGTVPEGALAPLLFQNSGGFVDEKGQDIRYLEYYSNAVHGLREHERPPYRAGGVLVGTPPKDTNLRPTVAP